MPECFFATLPGAGECDGPLRVCHLIPQQTLKREVATLYNRALFIGERPSLEESQRRVVMDERCWVPGCGGPDYGNAGHHGMFKPDGARPIPRELLPSGLEEFAEELGLGWWLDRTYGERVAV